MTIGDDEIYDYIGIDCEDCSLKFIVASLTLDQKKSGKKYPTKCPRCQKGLPPLYEY